MPLPPNETFTGAFSRGLLGAHPTGTFLFQGSRGGVGYTPDGAIGMTMLCVNIFGKKHEGEQVFCVEEVFTAADQNVTRTHKWKTEGEYAAEHMQLWGGFDMEPNKDFDVGQGIRSSGGAHLGGSNWLCERDGTLKPANIRDRC